MKDIMRNSYVMITILNNKKQTIMRPHVLIALRKAAEHVAKRYFDECEFTDAYLASAVANLLNAEHFMDWQKRNKLVDIAESIAKMTQAPNHNYVDLIRAYREELNRKEK